MKKCLTFALVCLVACGDGGTTAPCESPDEGCAGASETLALGAAARFPARDCLEVLEARPWAPSGLYWIDAGGAGRPRAEQLYCDMRTDGGGWLLLARFTQEDSIQALPQALYDEHFRDALWIEGQSQGAPESPDHVEGFRVESVDWAAHLREGRGYRLRQSMFTGETLSDSQGLAFDASWRFTYNGYVTQNQAPEAERAWVLTEVETYQDTTDILWHRPDETTRFWLPFKEGVEGYVYTACGGYQYSLDGCSMDGAQYRRFGNAGIIGEANDYKDPAGSWMPHTNTAKAYDLAFVHQDDDLFGLSGEPMTGLYWLRRDDP